MIAVARDDRIVGRANDGQFVVVAEAGEERADTCGVGLVEAGGRLVDEEHAWVAREGAGKGEAGALSARGGVGALVGRGSETDGRQRCIGVSTGVGGGVSTDERGQCGVLAGREELDEGWGLRDECQLAPAQLGELGAVESVEVAVADQHAAVGGALQAGEELQQRRLARSRGSADDVQPPTGREGVGERAEGRNRVTVEAVEVLGGDELCGDRV